MLAIDPCGTYIDATFGRGGHTSAILERLDSRGRMIVFDRDPEAQSVAQQLVDRDSRVTLRKAPFSAIDALIAEYAGKVDGVLFDLGLSSPQVDDPRRGFSFRQDGPLDMRMDPETGLTAADWLAAASEQEISDVLWRYGEERRSRQIAKRIVTLRKEQPITGTTQLAEIIRSCVRKGQQRIDPATRSFQAIRLHINNELGELEQALDSALSLLSNGGRLAVIAFHSLEDRIVKHRFRDLDRAAKQAQYEKSDSPLFRNVVRKPTRPTEEEGHQNPRARSARLRCLERVA